MSLRIKFVVSCKSFPTFSAITVILSSVIPARVSLSKPLLSPAGVVTLWPFLISPNFASNFERLAAASIVWSAIFCASILSFCSSSMADKKSFRSLLFESISSIMPLISPSCFESALYLNFSKPVKSPF